MRIAIGCGSLCFSRGGTERAAVNLAHEMTRRGHQVLILTLNLRANLIEPIYSLSPDVRHIAWTYDGEWKKTRYLKKFLIADQTDVFISMQSNRDHLFWTIVCMGSGIPFICSERSDPAHYKKNWNIPARRAVLSGADCIHELLPVHISGIPVVWHDKVKIIPNAAPKFHKAASPAGGGASRKHILYLARFAYPKQPLLLLQAFRLLCDKYPDWDLIMYGEGGDEEMLKNYIQQAKMEQRVFFPGFCADPESAYANAHIYCLPSSYEGFPNAMLEAMTAGLPVVCLSECPAGSDILRRGNTGLIVEKSTPEDLANALDKLMSNAELRASMGRSAKIAAARYEPARVYDQWENLFMEMAARKGKTVMDSFAREPFASMARLSSAARRDYIYRGFGEPMPYTYAWYKQKIWRVCKRLFCKGRKRNLSIQKTSKEQ